MNPRRLISVLAGALTLCGAACSDTPSPPITDSGGKAERSVDGTRSSGDLSLCAKAQVIEQDLVSKHGKPNFSCLTSSIHGVLVKVWCCAGGQRIVYYSFGYEKGCWESGAAQYACGGKDLPADVLKEIQGTGSNPCTLLVTDGCPSGHDAG